MENVEQIICQYVANSAKMTVSNCYTAEHAKVDFPKEKARRCSV